MYTAINIFKILPFNCGLFAQRTIYNIQYTCFKRASHEMRNPMYKPWILARQQIEELSRSTFLKISDRGKSSGYFRTKIEFLSPKLWRRFEPANLCLQYTEVIFR